MASQLLHQTGPFFRFLLFILVIYFTGFFVGSIFLFVFKHLYNIIMSKVFKLEPLSGGDRIFLWNREEDSNNLLAILVMEKVDPEAIKTMLIEKGIKKFKKMRSKRVYKFFDWWWQEIPLNKVLEELPIEFLKNKTFKANTKEDLVTCSYEVLESKFDMENQLPYSIKIIQNDGYKMGNLILFKFDHGLCDGMSFISLINALADNYDLKLFPQGNRKPWTLMDNLMFILSIPLITIKAFYTNLTGLYSGDTPFKLKDKKKTGIPKSIISEKYCFNLYSSINKRLKITFNDLMISVFSASIKKYCKNHYARTPEKFICLIAISHNKLPKGINDICITNNTGGVAVGVKLIDSVKKDSHIISMSLHKSVRNMLVTNIYKKIVDFLYVNLPHYVSRLITSFSIKNYDISISNVPGPKEPLYYKGCKIEEMICMMTPLFFTSFFGIVSYNESFTITMTFDKNLDINEKVLERYIHEEMLILKSDYESNTLVEEQMINEKKNN